MSHEDDCIDMNCALCELGPATVYGLSKKMLADPRDALLSECEKALEKIANADYRGNRCHCSQEAFAMLSKLKERTK